MTIRAGVIGNPIAHSLSPALHGAWLKSAGVDGRYEPFLAPRHGFAETVRRLHGEGVSGLNVTIPFKEEALALAIRSTEAARMAGAANLLILEHDGDTRADNTDGTGLLAAFAEQAPGFSPVDACVTILGAGGAARGAAAAFVLAGAAEVRLVNRTIDRAHVIAHELGGQVTAFGWKEVAEAMDGADALINATSLGLAGGDPLHIHLDPLPDTAAVMDMVYRPLETPLLAAARASGRPAVDGLAMLIGQARPSFTAFFGCEPPDVDVRAVALEAMR
ncbi:MAG TPA: shikimate dehydrogenase [Caulobacteraceae bacterium]|nr:shikimate dehydrogenase [Caulobacteraceae bacterium]